MSRQSSERFHGEGLMIQRWRALVGAISIGLVLMGASACDTFSTPAHELTPPPSSSSSTAGPAGQSPAVPSPGAAPTATPGGVPQPTVPRVTQTGGPASTPVPLAAQPIQSFRFAMVITDTTSAGVEVTSMTGEWTTEALHLVTILSAAGGREKTESYLIGDTVYVQNSKGNWTKGPSGDPEAHRLMNPTLAMKQAQEMGGLTLSPVGSSTVDGVACVRYQVTPQVEDPEVGSLFTQGVATVGLSNGWVYRFEFDRSEGGLRSQGFMVCTDYNTAITIKPPM